MNQKKLEFVRTQFQTRRMYEHEKSKIIIFL